MLTFDPEKHCYYWDGQPVPSVTSILNEWLKITVGVAGSRFHVNRYTGQVIASEIMEEGGAKGKDIHFGCELIIKGGICWGSLAPEYVAPLQQFEKWMDEVKPEILYTELAVYHPKYGYAGTLDILAKIGRALCFIDIKTGESGTVGPQLAAYEQAWLAENRFVGKTERYALWLPKNGGAYDFEPLRNPLDWELFKSCMFQKNYFKGAV
ncbi:MAG: hypothetical protein FD174_2605 [Geobacteraceae bacterium]|nr:MAG: hypothetical protein FD174_2605 [Geobacteraceae bacterium]